MVKGGPTNERTLIDIGLLGLVKPLLEGVE